MATRYSPEYLAADGPTLHKSYPTGISLSPQQLREGGHSPGYGPRLSTMKQNDFEQEQRRSKFANDVRGKISGTDIERYHEATKMKDQKQQRRREELFLELKHEKISRLKEDEEARVMQECNF